MALEARLGWRNVWRNPRRTALSVAATVFAVYLVVFFVAMAAGIHEKMIEDSVRLHSGHVVISGRGYLENRTLEHFLVLDPGLEKLLNTTPGVIAWTPRVVSFALLSKDSASQGAVILGVDPKREATVTSLPERVRRGRFLRADAGPDTREVVLGERLARSLGAEIGDQLLVYGAAYSLETAYELFTVVGVIGLPEPPLERTLAIISLRQAQKFFVYGDRISEIAVLASGADQSGPLRDRLRAALAERGGPPTEVHSWDQLMPELKQLIFLDDAGMYILLTILVIVVGFGILNTILMAVLERTRELGVMLALGLRPAAVFRIVYLESLFLAGIGLAIGLAAALPSVLYLEGHPVSLTGAMEGTMQLFGFEPMITWKLKPLNPLGSTLTILGVASLAALYPAWKASRGRPVDALRSL